MAFFISLFLISIFSCKQDDDLINLSDKKSQVASSRVLENPYSVDPSETGEDCCLPDPENPNTLWPEDLDKIRKIVRKYNTTIDKSLSAFSFPEINTNSVLKHHSNGNDIYAILINEDIPANIFNLVIKINQSGEVVNEHIYRYKLDPKFSLDYYSGIVDIRSFSGETQVFNPDQIFELTKQNSNCINNIEPCCIRPNGGGPSNTGGTRPGTGGTGTGGTGGDDCIFLLVCRSCVKKTVNTCWGTWHDGCRCSPPAAEIWVAYCKSPPNNDDDCCPGSSDEIPMNPGIDPSTVRDEEVPTDFTEELQAGLNSYNFLNNFLEGNTSLTQSDIIDAAECADCRLYPANSTFAPSNNYNQCVLTQILTDAPCGGALTDFMEYYSLTLTPAQQLNLVGPAGITSSCGENGTFVDEAFDILCENGGICVNDIEYIDIAPGDPVASSENPPCPELFNFFDPTSDSNNSVSEAIITNMKIQIEGLEQGIHFPNVLFQTTESPNCGVSSPVRAANVISAAIEEMETMLANNEPPLDPDPRRNLWILINRNFLQFTVESCGAESGSVVAQVFLPSDQSIQNEHADVDIVDFEEKFSECD